MSWDKENVPSTSPLPGHLPLFQRLSCWVILLSLLFGWGRKWEISPVMTWILASRMKSKSDKVWTKIISGEGELLSGLLVPSAVQFWKANMGNSNTTAWKDSFSHLMSVECVPAKCLRWFKKPWTKPPQCHQKVPEAKEKRSWLSL